MNINYIGTNLSLNLNLFAGVPNEDPIPSTLLCVRFFSWTSWNSIKSFKINNLIISP